jgi:hypothetical protein
MQGLVLLATSLAAFSATLDSTVVAVAVVDLQADLGAGVTELQGAVTACTVWLAALLLTAAWPCWPRPDARRVLPSG